jgi:tetratricopeptide (TPR) repeat protein
LDENKEKLTDGTPDAESIKDEMEELAKVFKQELDKAKSEAEGFTGGLEDLEIEGYNPQTVSRAKKTPVKEVELCEYCGEKPRGTEKDPDSPFCEDCESVLEKYPYDYRGIIVAILSVCITVAAVFFFAINVPVFSAMVQGDKAVEDGRLYTAVNKYADATEYAANISEKTYFNIHRKTALVNYGLVNMNSAFIEIDENIPDAVLRLLTFRDLQDILDETERMQASAMVIQNYTGKYTKIDSENYDKLLADLENLEGKKIYIRGTECHDETEKDFTPEDTDIEYICDSGWIAMYKYAAAQESGKDDATIAKFLQEAADSSLYMKTLVSSLLASTYAKMGEFDKAEKLAQELEEINCEAPDRYAVMATIYRLRDKDYAKAQQICDEGLKVLSGIPNGESYIMQYGYILHVQQTLSSIMQDDLDSAYETATKLYDNLSMTGGLTIQTRDLYAILAWATGDKESFEALEKEIESYGDESIAFSSDVTDFKAGKVTLKELVESGRYDVI